MANSANSWSPFGDAGRVLPMARPGVRLSIMEPPTAFTVRGDISDTAFVQGLEAQFGLATPTSVGGVAVAGDMRLLWLGPDAWLLLAPQGEAGDAPAIARQLMVLEARYSHMAAVDTSDTRAWLRLDGPEARTTLAKLTPHDLRDAALPVGACTAADLGPLHVLLERPEPESYIIAGAVSYAEHLAAMLADAVSPGGSSTA